MIVKRAASERGHFNHGWLDTYHTFSFASYLDPKQMGFRSLRVINEDWVEAGEGFGMHGHRDMEILTYVVEGELEHKDSTGGGGIIKNGLIQRMSAGTGIRHSEFNASKEKRAHLLQIWIEPKFQGKPPRYEDRWFEAQKRKDRLCLIASPDEAEGSLSLYQDARMYATIMSPGKELELGLGGGKHAWVQVVRGNLKVTGSEAAAGGGNDTARLVAAAELGPGDGAAVSGEEKLLLKAGDAEVEALIFELG